MRKILRAAFKAYMHDALLRFRHASGLNQEEMAHILRMSTRAYAALEAMSAVCSLYTFLIFVLRCCSDRTAFLDDLFDALDKALSSSDTAA